MIKTTGGHILGGYADITWANKDGGRGGKKDKYKSFLFIIRNGKVEKLAHQGKNGEYEIYRRWNSLEDFRYGFTIKSNCNSNYKSYSDITSDSSYGTYKYPAGITNWKKGRYAVAGTKDVRFKGHGYVFFKCAEHDVYLV